MLSAKEISNNYKKFRDNINKLFPDRIVNLNNMYDYFEDRIVTLPASGNEHYHNAFTGGYVDHVLRVAEFAEIEYEHWKSRGLKIDNFTLNELLFAAYHHDLGKVGMTGEYNPYQLNPSKWHRDNLGKLYTHDPNQPFMLIPDLSLFTLQEYQIPVSWSEYLAIRTHDGIYDKANEAYYFGSQLDTRARTNINQILHNADFAASRFEFERWVQATKPTFKFYQPNYKAPIAQTPTDPFGDIFKDFDKPNF
jgi:hypothetical protein